MVKFQITRVYSESIFLLFLFFNPAGTGFWVVFFGFTHAVPVVTSMWGMWSLLWDKWMQASVVWGHQFCTPYGRKEQVRGHKSKIYLDSQAMCFMCACMWLITTGMWWDGACTHWPPKHCFKQHQRLNLHIYNKTKSVYIQVLCNTSYAMNDIHNGHIYNSTVKKG